jgi:hypothetical protein
MSLSIAGTVSSFKKWNFIVDKKFQKVAQIIIGKQIFRSF